MQDERLLAIYLNDHLAGATLGVDLTKRCLRANRGTDLGSFLASLLEEIEEDRRTLQRVMARLGVKQSVVKPKLAALAERIGRLKLNGQVSGYSPLSRVLELEGLTIGIEGKGSLWRNLRAVGLGERLSDIDLDSLVERAEHQRSSVEAHRIEAAKVAFGAPESANESASTASGTSR